MAYAHILVGTRAQSNIPTVRRVAPVELLHVLRQGLDDFSAMPSHAVFLCVIYPLLGLLLVALTLNYSVLPLAFPLAPASR